MSENVPEASSGPAPRGATEAEAPLPVPGANALAASPGNTLVAEPPPAPVVEAPAPIVLRAIGLERSFGKVKALKGLNLEVRKGEIYGFLGRNGAGKTTTLRILMGILRADAGELELGGQRFRHTTTKLKRSLGYVSQEQLFYPWMTAQQLGGFVGGFYSTWDAQEFTRLLKLLDVPTDRKAAQMSGGTRMKLALALALAHRPEVLLMDEPTAGLDPVARHEFLEILVERCRTHGQTAIFSSHVVTEVEQIAQRVGILVDGKLRFEGKLAELRASVRRVELPSDGTLLHTERFQPLRKDVRNGVVSWVLFGAPDAWEAAPMPSQPLTLEEIFLAYARSNPGA